MKKTSKPAAKRPVAKKPAAKKSPTKPKRKAQNQSELARIVERLDAIMEKLDELLERGAQASAPPAIEPMHQPADEHADDVEVDSQTGEG